MKVKLKPLFSELNTGSENCPLKCGARCRIRQRAPKLKPPPGCACPLSSHQAKTYAAVMSGEAEVIFNKGATGDGKSLGGSLPSLLNPEMRMMGLYPTIELVEDQTRQQQVYHELFDLDAESRIDRLYGEELNRRVREESSRKFDELLTAIYHRPVLLTNPDIFHLMIHHRYINPAIDRAQLPLILAEWPDLWVFDEFHIFGPHQEAAALNSLTYIRRTQQRPRRFLFTSATPKSDFIEQLRKADFNIAEIEGVYSGEEKPGYRQILQPVNLEFVNLSEGNSVDWLAESAPMLEALLTAENRSRGLIILNAIASVNRVVEKLSQALPGVSVREISGRIDRRTRRRLQEELQTASQPVLIVATSAVDVGVDFRIHLLVFESGDAATNIQRLGRLGRHPGFSDYHAFILIPGRTPWVMERLKEAIKPEEPVERLQLQEAIIEAFEAPKSFAEYRQQWGPLQAQGMLAIMTQGKVGETVRDRMTADLERVYPGRLEGAKKRWYGMGNDPVGKATQTELLRFRGGSSLQAAVWEESRFYTYDLLRLLPYVAVELCDRETFLEVAKTAGYSDFSFPETYIQVYLKVREWVKERIDLELKTNRDSDELNPCELSLLDKLSIAGHPQPQVSRCLQRRQLLAFLVPVDRNKPGSHWDVSRKLRLSPLFGLYRITDAGGQAYACAFNQDALLLEALKWRLRQFCCQQPKSIIF
ncbi:MAG: type I-D CRISPR-associated helicase Cas3' [Limnospira sp.]